MASEQSNITKRHDQLMKWYESETDKASNKIKEADKIKFTKEVQFLNACNNSDWSEINRLLSEGIDINSTQDDGLTSLHQACIDDDEPLVKFLIDHGADIDAQDKEGWTPLFAAISCNYMPITKYLIKCGASLDMVSFDGELPLDQSSNNEAMGLYLKEEMTKRNLDPDEIRNRERNHMLKDVEYMKKTKDFSKYTMVDSGGSLLHIAASKDYIDVLEKLLEIISPQLLNHVDNEGWNALHVAAHWGNRKACVLLVNADIDFDKITSSNQTVLEVSDDDVKPYIREEIRKARFRRQERASKRPIESPNVDYQPSETKIICQDKKSPSPVNNQEKPNDDKQSITTNNTSDELLTHNKNIPTIKEGISEPTIQDGVDSSTCLPRAGIITSTDSFSTENSKKIEIKEESKSANDIKSVKVSVPVLPVSKTVESESQRKDKARHIRSTRRSTQGVTAEDIEEAKKLMLDDKYAIGKHDPNGETKNCDNLSSKSNNTDNEAKGMNVILKESETTLPLNTISDKSQNGENLTVKKSDSADISILQLSHDSEEQMERKVKTGGTVDKKRRIRERPPTGTVDLKDIQAAQMECAKLSDTNLLVVKSTEEKEEPKIDYKMLYEIELKEKERLQINLTKLQKDLERSQDNIRNLQNNHVVPKLQMQTHTIIPSLYEMKEMEKLREENKKMKDANSALIRVISRLSHPPPKSVSKSN